MGSKDRAYELTKLSVLSVLAEPEFRGFGLTGGKIFHHAKRENVANGDKVMDELEASGLVERRPSQTHKTARPYFITEAGTEYLENAKKKAFNPEFGRKTDWKSRHHHKGQPTSLAEALRDWPEFKNSTPERIQEACEELAALIYSGVSR